MNNMLLDDSLWHESWHYFFGGRCHTFDPPRRTPPGMLNSLVVAVKFPERGSDGWGCAFTDGDECFFGTFLHEKGAFIYNQGSLVSTSLIFC